MATDPNTTKARAASFTRNPDRYIDLVDGNASIYTEVRFHEYSRSISSQVRSGRTTAHLILPIPFLLNDITAVNIQRFDLDLIQNAQIAAASGVNTFGENGLGGLFKGAANAIGDATGLNSVSGLTWDDVKNVATKTASEATKIMALNPWANDGVSKAAQSYNGIVRNPHVSSIFNGVDLKTFQLNFRVSVGSAKEADSLNKAIMLIRNRMHPEAIADRLVLKYPDVATMKFVGMSKMVPRIKEAFIQQLNVTNFPQGPAVYRDGTPVEVLIDITLTEIDARMRDDEDNAIDDSFLIPSSAQSASNNGFSEGNI